MRLRNIPGAGDALRASEYVIDEPALMKNQWRSLFPRQKREGPRTPLHIEIGMGKGGFLHQMSLLHGEVDYVGIERYSSVLVRAAAKLEKEPRGNVRLVCADARECEAFFAPGEVDRIYLNFSDPWPKARHAGRRLPGREFLNIFEKILSPRGTIEFKTDNRELFDFALEEAKEMGWEIRALTYDLHHDPEMCEGNVMTEYEEKFSQAGASVCKYVISRSQEG